MRVLLIANLIVCIAILALIIYLHPRQDDNSFLAGIKTSPKSLKGVASQEIDYATSGVFMEKLRDTLSDELGSGSYGDVHTSGVRFMFEDIKAYMTTIYNKAHLRGLTDDSIRKLSIYICPGMYPKGYSHPTTGRSVSNKLTCFLFVPLKGEDIFNTTTRQLNIPQSMFLTAYDWGSLEPQ